MGEPGICLVKFAGFYLEPSADCWEVQSLLDESTLAGHKRELIKKRGVTLASS